MRREVESWGFAALVVLMSAACSMPSSQEPSGRGGSGGEVNGGNGAGGGSSGGAAAAGGSSGGGGVFARGGASGGGGSTVSGGGSGGGASATGGSAASGGRAGTGGSPGTGGTGGSSAGTAGGSGGRASGGGMSGGGVTASGGSRATGGAAGTTASGGRTGTGGAIASGGTTSNGGAGGSSPTGGVTAAGDCSITITTGDVSKSMATVGVVEWTTSLAGVASAQIVYTLNNAGVSVLNRGGVAPVDLKKPNYRTLLLGLKPASTYTFHVEATATSGATCKSADRTLTTGSLSSPPSVTRTAGNPSAQAVGFIVTSSGQSGGMGGGGSNAAYIIDADGTVVWLAAAPSQCSRAHMDFEGNNLWMLSLNVGNSTGEMRFISMDGSTSKTNVSGLAAAHHDFTVLPGKIAAMVWATTGARDPESNLVEMAADGTGTATTVFKIGANLYAGGSSAMGGGSNTYHCNHIVYHPDDDSFTIADRNPNLVVKVKHDGTPVWQIGGSCTAAKAPKCASGTWQVNHGQDLDGQGNMLIFNNGQSGASHVLELKLNETSSALSYTTTKDFTSGSSSNVMGDVQFLPNGNILITYSSSGSILEVDSAWATVQTLKASVGYAEWRETLYGPPTRK